MEDFLIALIPLVTILVCCTPLILFCKGFRETKEKVIDDAENGAKSIWDVLQTGASKLMGSKSKYNTLPHTDNIEGTINPTFEVEAPS